MILTQPHHSYRDVSKVGRYESTKGLRTESFYALSRGGGDGNFAMLRTKLFQAKKKQFLYLL